MIPVDEEDALWEKAMRRTLAEDVRYRTPEALDARIAKARTARYEAREDVLRQALELPLADQQWLRSALER